MRPNDNQLMSTLFIDAAAHGVTHLFDSFRYALDGFKNPAGIDVKSATIFGAFSSVVAFRADSSTSCTVFRSG